VNHGNGPKRPHQKLFSELNKECQEQLGCDLGKTGTLSKVHWGEHDEGEIAVAIGIFQGHLILDFGTPVTWLGMSLAEAETFLKMIAAGIDQLKKDRSQKNHKKS